MSIRTFFVRDDNEYTALSHATAADTPLKISFFLAMHIIPGIGAYLGMYVFREPLMAVSGISSKYIVALTLLTMAFGWHICGVFAYLRWIDKLGFRDSLSYLGLNRWDWKGMLVIVPLACLYFTVIGLPYQAYVAPPINEAINAIPAFHIYDWHIQKTGYFSFPLPLIILSFIGAHLGEEIYFRGFLLQKMSKVKYHWMINAVLFECYHVWQAAVNWSQAPLGLIDPFALIVFWRKNLWVSVAYHIFLNMMWDDAMAAFGSLVGIAF
jgi:uncharacterized protein